MIGDYILTFFLFRHLRKLLRDGRPSHQWDRILLGGMIASVALVLVGAGLDGIEIVSQWVPYLFMGFIVYAIYTEERFTQAKSVLTAVLPFMIAGLLNYSFELISPTFYASWKSYFEVARGFSLIWMIVMLIITNKQNKALAREREKTLEEEKQNKIMAQLKADLEVQVVERTAEITRQKEELLQALNELKVTQKQLIHSEKMASLGELTAGIAHEIQNPLNFVNNFSDINKEMLNELKEAIAQNDQEEIEAILKDLEDNENKVTHHGKRAEQIVKSMLQHSRTGSGEMEPTDLNALCDEYLRLSYHGYRAKDKSFQSDFKLDLDPDLPKVNVVPQDIGRVLLNLINNAFQAVSAIAPEPAEGTEADGNHKPLVTVTTKLSTFLKRGLGGIEEGHNSVVITVSDNGPGIPDNIKDKIFQPFFTTKPTGEGTGLGLSMSYDIVTRGHGGTIEVESEVGRGTIFKINLPQHVN